tara:strand:+ start:34084 stop:34344 length:261 start_codon:yes stop_codon:yes gene_type:complete
MGNLKNIENLYKKIFLLFLGSFLMVIPFYASSRSMLLLSDKEVSWGNVHTIFVCAGVVFFIGGWAFNSIARIIVKIAENYSNKLGK